MPPQQGYGQGSPQPPAQPFGMPPQSSYGQQASAPQPPQPAPPYSGAPQQGYSQPSAPPPAQPYGGYEQPGYGAAAHSAPLASWIQRVLALLLDYALVLPFSILSTVFRPKAGLTTAGGLPLTESGGSSTLALLMSLLALGVWLYNRCYLGGQGQSLGKKVLGLHLVSESTGQPIGMAMAFVRDLAHIVDQITCLVGWLFPLWDAKRQTFADKIVSTLVTTS